jgi:hypothetical protein
MLQTPRQPYLCFSASIRATASALGPFRVPWSERGGDGERLGDINMLYAKAAWVTAAYLRCAGWSRGGERERERRRVVAVFVMVISAVLYDVGRLLA